MVAHRFGAGTPETGRRSHAGPAGKEMADIEGEHLPVDRTPGGQDVPPDVFTPAAKLQLDRLTPHQRELVGTIEHSDLHTTRIVRLEMKALVMGARHPLLGGQVLQDFQVLDLGHTRHHGEPVVRRGDGREDFTQVGQLLVVLFAGPALVAHGSEIVVTCLGIVYGVIEVLQIIKHHGVSHTTNVNKNL